MNKKSLIYTIVITVAGALFMLGIYLLGLIFNNSSTGENILGKIFQ